MRLGHTLSLRRLAVLALLAASPLSRVGMGQATAAASGPAMSRIDIFVGYGYISPFNSDIGNVKYPPVPLGAVGNVAGYFGQHFGVQAEGNYSPNGPADNNCIYSAQGGPIVRFRIGSIVPFFHALGGEAIVGGPLGQLCTVRGWGMTAGGGFDAVVPGLGNHLAIRPLQLDFMYSQINNGPLAGGGETGGLGQVYAVRVGAGLVVRLGQTGPKPAPPTLACSVDPAEPFPGDPVTISGSTTNLNPKWKTMFEWTSSGGRVAGSAATAAIDTTGVEPGTYAVTGKLIEGKKQRLVASCSTSFTVRPFEPPTIACAADKAAINSGDPVAVTATGRSPQNRPLTYSYATTSGVIAGNGPTAALSTAGVSPGNITVTCNVTDDKGQTASATTSIVVATPPPPPPLPQVQTLCGITFDRDSKRPDRVDNEAKGCLDDVALTLSHETQDKLLIVGYHADKETNRDAAERAMNAAEYLTKEKGIDPARLDLRIGPDSSKAVAMALVPPGAVVDEGTATSFDAGSVQRSGQPYGTAQPPAPKKPVAKKKVVPKKKPAPKPVTQF